jgi:hypothetical protein
VNGDKRRCTRFTSSIKTPQVNANGRKVVFEKDYQLWAYDVKTGDERKLNISIIRNNILPKEKDFDVKGIFRHMTYPRMERSWHLYQEAKYLSAMWKENSFSRSTAEQLKG